MCSGSGRKPPVSPGELGALSGRLRQLFADLLRAAAAAGISGGIRHKPATASLALSLTTGTLAFAILLSGAFAQLFTRRNLMFVSMMLAAIANIIAASTEGWAWLLAARALEGFVLGGVPAVAMAYLAEEIEPSSLGKAMGLYVGGTAFGSMAGRVGMGLVSAYTSGRSQCMRWGRSASLRPSASCCFFRPRGISGRSTCR